MAEQVDLGDGNQVPQWVTEETGKKLVEQFKKLTDKNDKLADAFEKFIKTTTKHQKDSEEQEKEQKDALDEIKKAIGKDTAGMGKKGGGGSGGGKDESAVWKKYVVGIGDALKDLSLATFGLATQAMGLLAKSAYNVGDTLADLAQTGVGITESEVSQTTQTLKSLNLLGLNASEASGYLQNFSGAVQLAGQARIVAFNQALARSTNFGLSLGMTFNDLTAIIGEDLELRQKLGILNEMQAAGDARRSADLFRMQLAATALLGKSIQDIRDGSKAGIEENEYFATVVATMSKNLPGFADTFQTQVREFGSELAARGVSSELIGSINEMFAKPIAFMGDSGKELLDTFTVFGSQAGVDLVGSMENMQRLTQMLAETDDAEEAKKINASLLAERRKFIDDLGQASVNLTNNMDPKELTIFFDSLGGSARQLALMIPELSQVAGKSLEGIFLNSLLTTTKSFDQSMNTIKGAVSSALVNTSEGIAPLMQEFATSLTDGTKRTKEGFIKLTGFMGSDMVAKYEQANIDMFKAMGMTAEQMEEAGIILGKPISNLGHLTEDQLDKVKKTNSILESFQELLITASTSVAKALFGLEEDGEMFGVSLRENVTKRLNKFSEWFESGGGQKVVDTLSFFGNLIVGIAQPFIFVADLFVEVGKALTGFTGSLGDSGKLLGEILGTLMIASFASKALTGKGLVGSVMGAGQSLFGGGGGKGKGGGGKLPSGGAAAKTGAGFGAGAAGIAAFGAAAAGAGVAIAGFAYSVKTLGEMSWDDLAKGIAMTAIPIGALAAAVLFAGPALSAFGKAALPAVPILLSIAAAIASVGVAAAGIGFAAQAIGGLFPSETEKADAYATKIDASAKAVERLGGIPVEQIEATATAINSLGDALENMANKVGKDGSWWNPFDNDTGADLDKQNEQIDVFARFAAIDGTNMLNVATGISNITDAYGRFAELDGDAIMKNAQAITEFNQATGNTRMDRIMDFGMKFISGSESNSPTPDSNMVPPTFPGPTASNTGSAQFADGSTASLLKKIADNTEMTAKKTGQVKTVIENA